MEITIDELKIQPNEILSHLEQGYDVAVVNNGKVCAKIIPVDNDDGDIKLDNSVNELFGLWKDRAEIDDVAQYIRKMRQGRKL